MARQVLILPSIILLLSATHLSANPYRVPSLEDYLRGTFGEPLSIEDAYVLEKSNFRVENEFRYSEYTGFWDETGQKQDLRDWLYVDYSTRVVNFLSLDFGLSDNVAIGARIPFLWMNLRENLPWSEETRTFSNSGMGDVLLRVKVNPLGAYSAPARIALSAGVKLPSYEETHLQRGSGKVDFSLMGYAGSNLRAFELHAGLGYVVTGKTEYNVNPANILFYDIFLTGPFTAHSTWGIQFNGYTTRLTETEDDQDQDRFTVSPEIAITVPTANLKIGGGFSYDLFGMNAFRRSGPFLRMSVNPS
jgi:hypothetical protein